MLKKPPSNLNFKITLLAIIIVTIVLFIFFKDNWQNHASIQSLVNSSNPYVQEYSLQEGSKPNALLVDEGGIIWISTSNPKILLSLDPEHRIVKNVEIRDVSQAKTIPGNSTMTWTMIQDHDGKIWFSELGTQSIWQLNPENDTFHLFHSETGAPFQMKVGKPGEIWFTTLQGNTIGVIEKLNEHNDYKILTFETGNGTIPSGIFLQRDSMWVSNIGSQNISQYQVNRENNFVKNISMIQSIPRNNTNLFSSPTDLLVNGNSIWLTEHGTSFLTRYDLDSGKIVRYPTSQNHFHATTLPFWIRSAENPKVLWFNEHQGNKIGCFDLQNKTLVEYLIPSKPADGYLTYPLNLSEDPRDERILWFSEWNTDKVGMINGHIPVPFKITTNTKQIILDSNKTDSIIDLEIQNNSYNSNPVILNASSSITSTAELGNLTIMFSSDMVNLSHDKKIQMFVHNGGVEPGNYTVGINVSDGSVIKTEFLDLSILNR